MPRCRGLPYHGREIPSNGAHGLLAHPRRRDRVLLWYMVKVPGVSYSGRSRRSATGRRSSPGTCDGTSRPSPAANTTFGTGARSRGGAAHRAHPAATGYTVATQPVATELGEVRNIEAEIRGAERADEIVLVGAITIR